MEANREEPADGVIAKQYARFVSSLEPILSYLFGDDIFISYARTDTTAYAAALARHLTARNYSCYLDQWTTRPGTDLPAELLKAVRRSGIFVLLASAAATKSEAI